MEDNNVYEEIESNLINGNIKDKSDLNKIKLSVVRKNKFNKIPSNIEILEHLNEKDREKFRNLLTSKPIRTLSGVAPIAVMTMPIACKHGKCTFCPGGPNSYYGNIPMSYTGNEPSTMRSIRANYDPYLIVFNRLEQYILLNQVPEKTEVIIQGGTFTSFPVDYQDYVVKYTLKAMNDFSEIFFENDRFNFAKFKEFFELPGTINNKERTQRIHEKLSKIKGEANLEREKIRNEYAKIRCVVMNIETKPDWCFEPHLNQMLKLGTTRVEIGVQSLFNEILKITNRGHSLEDTKRAMQLTKDCFLKTCGHLMIGLPKTTEEMDINNFKQLFEDENYKPDALKIYPCMVMPGTPLYLQYKKGEFKPLRTEEAANLLLKIKPLIPNYTRVMRILRDIPTKFTADGVDITNFRQYLHELMKKNNVRCRCIRCREPMNKKVDFAKIELSRYDYDSSGGKEIFLSYEEISQNIILGFVRLRIPYKPFRPEITNKSVGIREIHIYGNLVPLEETNSDAIQHHGLGKKLMYEAERIAKEEYDSNKILVNAGVGARAYFYKLGYKKESVYLSKKI